MIFKNEKILSTYTDKIGNLYILTINIKNKHYQLYGQQRYTFTLDLIETKKEHITQYIKINKLQKEKSSY